jgi:hypothetical protein
MQQNRNGEVFLQVYSSQMSSKFEVVTGLTNMPKYVQELKIGQ